MSLTNARIIAQKEFSIMRLKKTIIYFHFILPLALSIGLPLLTWHVIQGSSKNSTDILYISGLLNAFEFFFAIIAVILSSYTAAYSVVGEKIRRVSNRCLPPRYLTVKLFSVRAFLRSFHHLSQCRLEI